MKVVIADDHALVREGILHVLEGCEGIEVVLEATSHASLLSVLHTHSDIGLILLDINMDDLTTTQTIQDLHQQLPSVKIAILSVTENAELARDFINAGAVGYIPKSSTNAVLLNAVQLVINGGIFIPPMVMSAHNTTPKNETNPQRVIQAALKLTARQHNVLHLMAEGHANKEIALKLDLSLSTIKTHVSAILESFAVDNRMKAVNEAIKMGLITDQSE